MCIAILNQSNLLSKETLKNCWDANNDGAGLMCISRGKLLLYKEMTNFEAFYEKYASLRKKNKNKFLLHFRIATQGEKTVLNCHPFQVNDTLGYCHNGMLRDMPHSSKYSDTYLLNSLILSKFPIGFEKFSDFKDILGIFAGTFSNKLIFLNTENEHYIINETQGHWKDGDWYSNYSYIRNRTTSYNTNSPTKGECLCGSCGKPCHYLYDGDCWQCNQSSSPAITTGKKLVNTDCDICGGLEKVDLVEEVGVNMCQECKELIMQYN